MVRPNAEVIPSQHTITVKIMTQHPISQATKELVNDRFLVQLTKLEQPPGNKNLQADEIQKLWERIDKSKLLQYKLKVDLNQDCMKIIDKSGNAT